MNTASNIQFVPIFIIKMNNENMQGDINNMRNILLDTTGLE